jgi:3'-phosphoadenosine 5'-phosphosulfate sulfotransferase (PAPS reductase)/FAD synthetase
MKNIVSFSGGKDSTAMLLMMIEKKIPIDYILYVDTTKEFPQMYEHIGKISNYVQPLKITKLSFDFDYYLGEHIKTKGKNKGKRGYGWPDFMNRWCTRLKTRAIKKYVDSIDGEKIEYIGIAYDEKDRAYKNLPKDRKPENVFYPLIDWKITESMALEYCYNKGFDWGGLYENFQRLSCFCCPLSKIGELRNIFFNYPELWNKIKQMDDKSYRKFLGNYTIKELEEKFKYEKLYGKKPIRRS